MTVRDLQKLSFKDIEQFSTQILHLNTAVMKSHIIGIVNFSPPLQTIALVADMRLGKWEGLPWGKTSRGFDGGFKSLVLILAGLCVSRKYVRISKGED